ncbi:hypothetical protein AQUCO_01300783v1 [Aquilegia coerulea]|uniref:Uncharacterized protein n=1 Tax=Aquilegia coerulea TaxID=218851 RepID=A0A2G5E3D4_AQUCA|nr:hypothetical protein AQUCO_01300783v1 [Aquilegia coerulea]
MANLTRTLRQISLAIVVMQVAAVKFVCVYERSALSLQDALATAGFILLPAYWAFKDLAGLKMEEASSPWKFAVSVMFNVLLVSVVPLLFYYFLMFVVDL